MFSRASRRKLSRFSSKSFNFISFIILIAFIILFIFAQNNLILTTNLIFESDKIPKTFVGYKIVQVSDIANDTGFLVDTVSRSNPDIVIVTGNIADKDGKYNNSISAIKKLCDNYTVAYVLGEMDEAKKSEIANAMDTCGAVCIENKCFDIKAPNVSYDEFIDTWIEDRYIKTAESNPDSQEAVYLDYTKKSLEEDKDAIISISGMPVMNDSTNFIDEAYKIVNLDRSVFQVLAINQGEYLNELSLVDIDIIMAGNQFGKASNTGYRRGIYANNGSTLLLSGGIGDNPDGSFRFLNMPNIISVTLSDGTINKDNPLEKLLGNFIGDVGTRFDGDAGFTTHRYEYT